MADLAEMLDDMMELTAPGGCDEANHGTERYRVDNSGRVRVPREAAHYLIRKAGFKPAPAPEPTRAPRQDGGGAEPASPREGGDPRRVPKHAPAEAGEGSFRARASRGVSTT